MLKNINTLKTKSSVRKDSNTSNHSRECPLLGACLFSICIAPYLFTLTDTVSVSGVKSDAPPVPTLNKLKINKRNEPAKLNAPKQHISVIFLLQQLLLPGSDTRGVCHCPAFKRVRVKKKNTESFQNKTELHRLSRTYCQTRMKKVKKRQTPPN